MVEQVAGIGQQVEPGIDLRRAQRQQDQPKRQAEQQQTSDTTERSDARAQSWMCQAEQGDRSKHGQRNVKRDRGEHRPNREDHAGKTPAGDELNLRLGAPGGGYGAKQKKQQKRGGEPEDSRRLCRVGR